MLNDTNVESHNRSSRQEAFCKKDALRNFAKITGVSFLIKLHDSPPKWVFSCKFWEISKNTHFYRTLPAAASVTKRIGKVLWISEPYFNLCCFFGSSITYNMMHKKEFRGLTSRNLGITIWKFAVYLFWRS